MAIVDVTEYSTLAKDQDTRPLQGVGLEPALASQQVAIGGSSAQSAAFGAATKFVRVHADAPCRIAFGANPTAATTSMRLAGGVSEIFGVYPGHKVAVITTT